MRCAAGAALGVDWAWRYPFLHEFGRDTAECKVGEMAVCRLRVCVTSHES